MSIVACRCRPYASSVLRSKLASGGRRLGAAPVSTTACEQYQSSTPDRAATGCRPRGIHGRSSARQIAVEKECPREEETETLQYWNELRRELTEKLESNPCVDKTSWKDVSFLGDVNRYKNGDVFRHLHNLDSVLPNVDYRPVRPDDLGFCFVMVPGVTEFHGYRAIVAWARQLTKIKNSHISHKLVGDSILLRIQYSSRKEAEIVAQCLDGTELDGVTVRVVPTDDYIDRARNTEPLCRPYKMDDTQEEDFPNMPKGVMLTPSRKLALMFCPLRHLSPEDQCKHKMKAAVSVLAQLGQELIEAGEPDWLQRHLDMYDGFPCKLHDMIPSPLYHQYRHKSSFMISRGLDTDELRIGYHHGAYGADLHMPVAPRSNCTSHQYSAFVASQELQACLLESKKFSYYIQSPPLGEYMWLLLRSTTQGDLLATLMMHRLDKTEAEVREESQRIGQYFTEGPGKGSVLKGCFILVTDCWMSGNQVLSGYHHCFGNPYTWEKINGITLRAGANVFFQSNIECTEILYTIVHKMLNVTKDTIVFDVGCGTGSVGLINSKFCKEVIGIDKNHQAILDAKFNAKINGMTNCTYHRSALESKLPELLRQYSDDEDVAVVLDPERVGFSSETLLASMRKAKCVKRLVFIACGLPMSKRNIVSLCKQSDLYAPDEGFKLIKAIPLDMFPQTHQLEWALLLERTSPS